MKIIELDPTGKPLSEEDLASRSAAAAPQPFGAPTPLTLQDQLAGIEGLGRFVGAHPQITDVAATTGVGATANALAAPLAAFGPPGIAASRVIPGVAVGTSEYLLSKSRGEPTLDAAKNALISGGLETVAPFIGKGLGGIFRGMGGGAQRLLGKGANRALTEVTEQVPNFLDDLTREAAGNAAQRGIREAAEASADDVARGYAKFRSLGGSVQFDYDSMADKAQTMLRNPGLSREARTTWKGFLNQLKQIKRGELDPFTLESADEYVRSLKRAARAQSDGNIRHAISDVIGTVESSMDDAAKTAKGGPDALAELRNARSLFKQHVATYRESALGNVLDDATGEATTRFIQNASPAEIQNMRRVMSPASFDSARASFFRDKILKGAPEDEINIRQLYRRVVSDRKTREQFMAYYDGKAMRWLNDVSRAYKSDKMLAPLLRPNGSLVIPSAASAGVGAGVGYALGGGPGAAVGAATGGMVTLGAITYSQLIGSPGGRRVLSGLMNAARIGNEVGIRGALQSARSIVQAQGGSFDGTYTRNGENQSRLNMGERR